MSLLGRDAIRNAIADGRIIIEPFDPEWLGANSYDARLGNWYYRACRAVVSPLDPYDEPSVRAYWGEPRDASAPGYGGVIIVHPGETVLTHTREIVGGVGNIVPMMDARSSIARLGLSVCKCAGLGDVGYVSRWTMEISNHGMMPVMLRVGQRVCQFEFHAVEYVSQDYRDGDGKYGSRDGWTPDDMLPKVWLDRDARDVQWGKWRDA